MAPPRMRSPGGRASWPPMIPLVILGMLAIAGAVLWWAVDGRERFARPAPELPDAYEVAGFPSYLLRRWVAESRPGPALTIAAAVMLAVSCLGAFVFQSDIRRGDAKILAALVALGAAAIALAAIGSWLRRRTPPVIRALRDRGREIVWVYARELTRVSSTGRRTGHVAHEVVICLADGTKLAMPAMRAEADEAIGAIARLCPGARVGFDPSLERRFAAAPSSLGPR